MKKIIGLITTVILLLSAVSFPSSAAGVNDYIALKWALPENEGKVEQHDENTVKVTGRGVWETDLDNGLCGIVYKEKVPVNGFSAGMTFLSHYGMVAQDGWYGFFLNNKPLSLASSEKYSCKGFMVLFKINRAQSARKRVTIEISRFDRDGITNLIGSSIVKDDLPADWTVDFKIENGKFYVCGEMLLDVSTALKSQFSDGKAYPSFCGFAEDYRELSFTVNYAAKPAGTVTPGGTQSTPSSVPSGSSVTGSNASTPSEKNESTQSPDTSSDASSDTQSLTSDTESGDTSSVKDESESSGESSQTDKKTEQKTEVEKNKSNGKTVVIIIISIVVLAAAGALVFIKIRKGRS